MTGLESLALSKLTQEGMNKMLEQNALSPAQASAQEGKIPNIAEMNKDCMDVQNRLAEKLAPTGEQENLLPEEQTKKELPKIGEEELREAAPEGKIKEHDPYSEIRPEENQIYDKLGHERQTLIGRDCLTHPDIGKELNFTDARGQTNLQRMREGLAPVDSKGIPYEIHHVNQKNDGILAELRRDEHRSPPNNTILHQIRNGSEVDHGIGWDNIRESYWKARYEQFISKT